MTRKDRNDEYLRRLRPLQGAVEAYCRRALFDENAVEDVVQSVVANTFRDFDSFIDGTSFRAWIFRYTHLEIQNANRKSSRDRCPPLGLHESVEDFQDDECREMPAVGELLGAADELFDHWDEAIRESVRDLPSNERSILLLRSIAELSYREIAETLHLPIGTVMSGLSRGRARLRKRLHEYVRDRGFLRWGEKHK